MGDIHDRPVNCYERQDIRRSHQLYGVGDKALKCVLVLERAAVVGYCLGFDPREYLYLIIDFGL